MTRHPFTLWWKILASVLLFGAVHSVAFAWGYSGEMAISTIMVDTADNVIQVYSATGWANPDSCTGGSSAVAIPMTGNYKDAEAAVYTAFATGTLVQFALDGCTYTAGGYEPTVTIASIGPWP